MGIIKKIRMFFKFLNYTSEQDMRDFAVGFNSFINKEQDLHIIMLDYDIKDLNFVKADASEITEHFKLSDFEIYKTQNGYHCFWFYDFYPYSKLRLLIEFSRCDNQFKYISRFYDHKTIRVAGKYKNLDIKFIGKFAGIRKATPYQMEIGNLKREEYVRLKSLHKSLNKNNLKDNTNETTKN